MNNYERIPLKKGEVLHLKLKDSRGVTYSQKAEIEEFLGEGASCLSYIVNLQKDSIHSTRMIMKEFYPIINNINIKRVDKKLNFIVDEESRWDVCSAKMRFEKSYEMQNKLSGSDAMEIMVKPYQIAEYGDSLYLLSEMNKGQVLSTVDFKNFSQKIWVIYRLAEAMQLLHEQGYIYMDIKPKNILWIESQQIVKLFDVDSIISYKKLDDVHEIYVTEPYVAPEIKHLEKWFEHKKKDFLRPSWDIYCLGLLLFELVFERFPTKEDQENGCGKEGELEHICKQNGYDEKTCEGLKDILKHSLSQKFISRYKTAQDMCEALNELKTRVDARAFISKKEFVKANATMKAYYMLDRWPLYQYGKKIEGEQKILDVTIIGEHAMREEFVKAIYSCTHMLDTTLRLRIYAPDVKVFWEKLEEKNPLLGKTIKLYINGKAVPKGLDTGVCSQPIAEIYLYEKKDIVRLKSDYIILLEGKSECRSIVRRILERYKEREQKLVAYLDDGTNYLQAEGLQLVPISLTDKCSYYDEKLLETELLQRALHVHALYYRENHKRATWDEIKKDFESNIYSIESSMRAALTVKYKMASVELDAEADHIAEKYFEKVLAPNKEAKERFDKLTALEHLSWSAYMIINGWNAPTKDQIRDYAFVGRNDFKEKKEHLHPCLAECRPGRGLADWSQKDWKDAFENEEMLAGLDGLDRMSVELHHIARKKVPKAVKKVNSLMDSLLELVLKYHAEEISSAYKWLGLIKDRIFAGENNAEAVWKQAQSNFLQILKRLEISNPQFEELLTRVNQEMRVIHEYHSFHDYKKSDEAIIYGIPYILSGDKVRRVMKPYIPGEHNRWKNLLLTLYLEPEELIFISKERKESELKFYQKFLSNRGIHTKVSMRDTEVAAGDNLNTVWDVTGLKKGEYKPNEKAVYAALQEGEIVGLSNYVKGQFLRSTHLTVEETFDLFGANIYLNEREEIALSLGECYQKIWEAYRKIKSVSWDKMAETLLQVEKSHKYMLPMEKEEEVQTYWTVPVSGKAVIHAQIHKILKSCQKEGLIEEYYFPGEEDELSIWVKTRVSGLFEILNQIILLANDEPLRHQFHLERGEKRRWVVRDKSLYVACDVDEELEKVFHTLEEQGKDPVRQQTILQNMKIQNGKCTFKYANKGVKKCLQSKDMILDVVLYYACMNTELFDDVDIGTRYFLEEKDASGIWGSGKAKMNSVTGNIECIDGEYKIVIHCEKDYFRLSGDSEKRIFYNEIDVKEKKLQEQILSFFQEKEED